MPAVPHLRLATLSVALIGFGIALDRLGFGGAGIGELLLFLGTAAAGMGASSWSSVATSRWVARAR